MKLKFRLHNFLLILNVFIVLLSFDTISAQTRASHPTKKTAGYTSKNKTGRQQSKSTNSNESKADAILRINRGALKIGLGYHFGITPYTGSFKEKVRTKSGSKIVTHTYSIDYPEIRISSDKTFINSIRKAINTRILSLGDEQLMYVDDNIDMTGEPIKWLESRTTALRSRSSAGIYYGPLSQDLKISIEQNDEKLYIIVKETITDIDGNTTETITKGVTSQNNVSIFNPIISQSASKPEGYTEYIRYNGDDERLVLAIPERSAIDQGGEPYMYYLSLNHIEKPIQLKFLESEPYNLKIAQFSDSGELMIEFDLGYIVGGGLEGQFKNHVNNNEFGIGFAQRIY